MNGRMLTGLRTRLLVSYVLILLVSLTVIAVALLVFLRGQSPLTEGISLRLYTQLQQLDVMQDQQGLIPDSGPTLVERAALNRLDQRIKSRILLMNAEGKVSYDSR